MPFLPMMICNVDTVVYARTCKELGLQCMHACMQQLMFELQDIFIRSGNSDESYALTLTHSYTYLGHYL